MKKLILFALFLLQISGLHSQTCPSDPSLVLCMPMNGNTVDESGYGNNGIQYNVGFTTDRCGNANGALQLNGVNSYVEIPDAPSLRPPDGLTLACWAKWDASIYLHPMMITKTHGYGYDASYLLYNYIGLNGLYGNTLNTGVTAPFNTVLGTWYHVVFTFDDATNKFKLFLDGALVATLTQSGSMQFDHHPVFLGVDTDFDNFTGNSWIQGAMDDVRIYSRALSEAEVAALYNNVCGQDADFDGISDEDDNCVNTSNTDQADADNDGIGDACDTCPNDADNDADDDGVCGNVDNCALTSNADQADADNDGIGDACEDSDCDGISDSEDLCPGGDDSMDNNGDEIPDCSQLLDYGSYSAQWKCAHNKIQVCHNGSTKCINKNALSAHFNHGDIIGPCTTCPQNRLAPIVKDNLAALDQLADRHITAPEVLELALTPNPASDIVTLHLGILPENQVVMNIPA